MSENTEKKFLGMDAATVAVAGLFLAILSVMTVLATFAFNTIRADYARIEAGIADTRAEWKADIADLRAEQKTDISGLRAEQRSDTDRLSDKIDSLKASIDARLDEIEREQARLQGAVDVLRSSQAQNP